MEKLEYIPGDLVFHYIPKTTIKKYVKVYVCSTNNALSLEDMDGKLYDYIGVLYPIPLTPDILEKNEWKKLYEKFFEKNVNDIRLTIEFSENIYVAINRIFIMEIHYIHELQHLLFGLGLNSEMEV
ncbi:hypothetical protein [Segatella copri]|jgi:hypothetical protein|uniref:Uncharacterized protein n=1 Tax=Segatella copri TaxID=165179 RepID=A0A414YGF1_9BACT|nr:hypothetical protein [Segatella copri]RHH85232.1 hypothetical protein DW192_00430 [Segatella copri]DAZ79321.1 MAG TPA: hypothetical protein [Caudoviricetes sp.]